MPIFEIIPDIPINKHPIKPSDNLGHMAQMCTDIMKDIKCKEIPLQKQVLLNMAMMQMRKQLKMIYMELHPPKEKSNANQDHKHD